MRVVRLVIYLFIGARIFVCVSCYCVCFSVVCAVLILVCIVLILRLAVSSFSVEIKFCERWRRRFVSLLVFARLDCVFVSWVCAFSSAIWKGVLSIVSRRFFALISWLFFIFSLIIRFDICGVIEICFARIFSSRVYGDCM